MAESINAWAYAETRYSKDTVGGFLSRGSVVKLIGYLLGPLNRSVSMSIWFGKSSAGASKNKVRSSVNSKTVET